MNKQHPNRRASNSPSTICYCHFINESHKKESRRFNLANADGRFRFTSFISFATQKGIDVVVSNHPAHHGLDFDFFNDIGKAPVAIRTIATVETLMPLDALNATQ